MNSSACSTVICQPGGREQNHDIMLLDYLIKWIHVWIHLLHMAYSHFCHALMHNYLSLTPYIHALADTVLIVSAILTMIDSGNNVKSWLGFFAVLPFWIESSYIIRFAMVTNGQRKIHLWKTFIISLTKRTTVFFLNNFCTNFYCSQLIRVHFLQCCPTSLRYSKPNQPT